VTLPGDVTFEAFLNTFLRNLRLKKKTIQIKGLPLIFNNAENWHTSCFYWLMGPDCMTRHELAAIPDRRFPAIPDHSSIGRRTDALPDDGLRPQRAASVAPSPILVGRRFRPHSDMECGLFF